MRETKATSLSSPITCPAPFARRFFPFCAAGPRKIYRGTAIRHGTVWIPLVRVFRVGDPTSSPDRLDATLKDAMPAVSNRTWQGAGLSIENLLSGLGAYHGGPIQPPVSRPFPSHASRIPSRNALLLPVPVPACRLGLLTSWGSFFNSPLSAWR